MPGLFAKSIANLSTTHNNSLDCNYFHVDHNVLQPWRFTTTQSMRVLSGMNQAFLHVMKHNCSCSLLRKMPSGNFRKVMTLNQSESVQAMQVNSNEDDTWLLSQYFPSKWLKNLSFDQSKSVEIIQTKDDTSLFAKSSENRSTVQTKCSRPCSVVLV